MLSACGSGGGGTPGSGTGGSGTPADAAGGTGGAGTGTGGAGTGGSGTGGATAGSGGSGSGGTTDAGAGGDAAAGDGGGADAAGPVAPVMRNGRYAFDLGDIVFEVDPQVGGRITTLSIGQSGNLLTGPAVNQTYWGSTFWTSPESDWRQPPPPEIDSAPFTVTTTATSVTVVGPTVTNAPPPNMMVAVSPLNGLSLGKTFSADRRGTIQIVYQVTNHKQGNARVAPWEVTRVFPSGVTFFPTGTKMTLSQGATLPTTNMGGITWFTYNAAAITADSKLIADGTEGWMAHADKGILFIKKFGDVPPAQIAPNEGDVELYTNKLRTYIEMEDQGVYATIAPGASTTWTVTWYLRRLPAGVMGTAGEAALVQFVRDTIK